MTESAQSIEKRVDELEFRAAFQEDTLAQLNDVIAQQRNEIDHLTKQLGGVIDTLRSTMQTGGSASDIDEKPPHY